MKGYGRFFKVTSLLSALLRSLAFSLLAQKATAQSDDKIVTIEKNDKWIIFRSQVILIMFVAVVVVTIVVFYHRRQ